MKYNLFCGMRVTDGGCGAYSERAAVNEDRWMARKRSWCIMRSQEQ